MSSAVSSLLVRDQVVAVRLVESALERQVLYGGDLETNLLELKAAHEEVLAEYRARAVGAAPAGRRDLAEAAPEALRMLSREHAEKYRIVPLRVEGHVLYVAAAEPPPPEAIDELSFLLSVEIAPRIAMEHRMAWALQRYYGLPIAPRMRRILDRIAAEDDEARSLEAGMAPAVLQTPGVSIATGPPPPEPEPAPRMEPIRIEPMIVPRGEPTERFPPLAPKTAVDFPAVVLPLPPAVVVVAPPTVPPPAVPAPAAAPTPPAARAPLSTQIGMPAIEAPEPEEALEDRPSRPSSPPRMTLPPPEAPSIDLPATFADRLAIAASRDDVVDTLLAAGHYLFEYVAVFAVHDGVADGKVSIGAGAPTNFVRQIHVPLDVPSSFRSACESRSVFLGPPSSAGIDAEVLAALGRRRAPPSICLVPVGMRGRTVLLLYADAADRAIAPKAATEIASLGPRAAMSLERVILTRKIADRSRRASHAPRPEPAVVVSEGVPIGDLREDDEPDPPADPEPATASERARATDPDLEPVPPEGEMPFELSVRKSPAPPAPDAAPERLTVPSPPPDFAYEEISVADTPEADDTDLWEDEPEEIPPEDGDVEEDLEVEVDEGSLRGEIDRLLRGYVEPDPSLSVPRRVKRIRSKQQTLPEVGRPAALQQPVSGISGRHGTDVPRPAEPEGPNVIFDVGTNVEELVEALSGPPEESDLAAAGLQKIGEAALPALIRRFPGPLRFDRRTARGPLPRAADCGPLLRLLVAFRRLATSYIRPLFESVDSDARFYAVLLARDYQSPELVPQLERRVFDEDYGVRVLALDTLRLHRRFPEFDATLRDLRSYAGDDRMPLETRLRSTEALGSLLDVGSLRVLVGLLDAAASDLRQAALAGLVAITCQDFGLAPRKWIAWLEKNGGRHRIEWLIDALVHASADIRMNASEELKRITKEYFGYYYNLPKRDRERARKRYLDWWARVGRARFAS